MTTLKAILGVLSGFALIAFTYLCITISMAVQTNSKHIAAVTMQVGDTLSQVNKTLSTINGKGGLLQQSAETVVRVKDLITLSQLTLYKQQKSINDFDTNLVTTSKLLNAAIYEASQDEVVLKNGVLTTMQFTNDALVGIQNDTVEAHTDLITLNAAVASTNQTIIDADSTVKSLDATAEDLQYEVHKLVHPTKKKLGFWGTIWAGVQIARKFEPSIF